MPRIAVAGPSSAVTDAAVAVGDSGGSVVDVGVAASLAAMCTEPGVCGPGGGGFLTIDVPGHKPVVIDGYMNQPGLGFSGEVKIREVNMSYGGGVRTLVDAGSIAVPGGFAAFDLASRMFGRLPWRELMGIVADHVEGFPLSFAAHFFLNHGATPIYDSDPAAREALFVDGAPRPLGTPIVFHGLADTLRRIGEEGARALYGGDLGREVAEDLSARGSMLTLRDLESYEAHARPPLIANAGDWKVATNPRPAVGGEVLVDVLKRIHAEPFEDALVSAFRTRREGSKTPSTISVAAADDEGGGVAGSFSAGYGSGIVPTGTGMLMNNAIGEVELTGGRPGTPGERMVSNMAPTVAKLPNATVAIGSPGADRITSALATTLLRIAAGDRLENAIIHPRMHPEFGEWGVRLAVEPGADVSGAYELREFDDIQMYFGGVNAAGMKQGVLNAFADPRRTGAVAFSNP